jgi:threonine-phosphate decarboxylase
MSLPLHGGQAFALARELNCSSGELLDFSASINPLGPPPGVAPAVNRAMKEIVHYPDLQAEPLAEALADHHGLPTANLLAGAGATEFIFLIPRVLQSRKALIVEPAFSEYAVALARAGCRVESFSLEPGKDFRFDPEQLLNRLSPEIDLVVLANPANPTGMLCPPALLRDLLDRLPGQVTLLLDEAFVDFCPEFSVIEDVTRRSNLLVMRSMTKFYAIPGLRVGYLAGSSALIGRLALGREPWRLSTPAISAAIACLADDSYRQRTLSEIPRWRDQLSSGLSLLGCRVFAGAANYLLCRLPEAGPTASSLAATLRSQKILVRDCSDFVGLDERFLRLSVQTEEDNRQLLRALGRCLGEE